MDPRSVLSAVRNGAALSDLQLQDFARGLADGRVSDAQGAAFAMGVCKSNFSESEILGLTRAMRDSGDILFWDLPGPVVDKHSTGGLGDSTSLVIAPILAAMGAYAPLLSGRGLGHTGGTLDKLESLAGVKTEVSEDRLRYIVEDVGCAIVGATKRIAPADRKLYALRDHTATVDSIALITASILSKKLAGGAGYLMLDVKGGSGAFMKSRDEALTLAQLLVDTANAAGCKTRALITDMNQPLARSVGNAVELAEVLSVLRDPKPDNRLCQLSLALAGELAALSGLVGSAEEGGRAALKTLQSGAAAAKFGDMIHALGGPAKLMDTPEKFLPKASVCIDVPARAGGKIAAIDGVSLGQVVQGLGGGRMHPLDRIDASVGLTDLAFLGQSVQSGQSLARIHASSAIAAEDAVELVRAAFQIGPQAAVPPLIHERIA